MIEHALLISDSLYTKHYYSATMFVTLNIDNIHRGVSIILLVRNNTFYNNNKSSFVYLVIHKT